MDEHASRIARTEALFRDVNERIAEGAERFDAQEAEFVCECADVECTDRVEATLYDYEHVRADGARFIPIAALVKRLDPRTAPSG